MSNKLEPRPPVLCFAKISLTEKGGNTTRKHFERSSLESLNFFAPMKPEKQNEVDRFWTTWSNLMLVLLVYKKIHAYAINFKSFNAVLLHNTCSSRSLDNTVHRTTNLSSQLACPESLVISLAHPHLPRAWSRLICCSLPLRQSQIFSVFRKNGAYQIKGLSHQIRTMQKK